MYDIVQRHAFNTDMMGSMYSKSNFVRATVHMELCYEHTFYNLSLQMDIDKK